jgi:hypothetical protein
MTAATGSAGAPLTRRDRRIPLIAPARLLRLELRRNPMLWMLPLLVALFWLGVYRPAMANPPLWNIRATDLQHAVLFLGPLLAGTTAWIGSRDGRRGLTDLIDASPMPRWAGQLAMIVAATCWAELVYLAGVAVVYGVTAEQAHWGGPLWWPVAVGAAAVATCCTLGFAAGALLPGRFTAALAAVVVFLALAAGAFAIQSNATYAQIWPLNVQGSFPSDSYGIFYPYLPDLPIAQLILLAGVTSAALGLLALPSVNGRWQRAAAAALTTAGLAAAATAVSLAGTARLEAHGIVIPALHNAASDRPVPYVPVCSHSAIPVCVHPAYRPFQSAVTSALWPVLSQVVGLPGAPVRVTQVGVTSVQQGHGSNIAFGTPIISGMPAVLYVPLAGLSLPGESNTSAAEFVRQLRGQDAPSILNAIVGLPDHEGLYAGGGPNSSDLSVPKPDRGKAAQLAVAAALAKVAGLLPGAGNGEVPTGNGLSLGQAMVTAIERFAALPPAARHAWLVAHLAALRAGQVALSKIP